VKLTWDRDRGKLSYLDKVIDVTCYVRNELNGERSLDSKPVYTTDAAGATNGAGKSVPYMPRPFPKGTWTVTGVYPKSDPYMAPEFIATDARQTVTPWTVIDGHYGAPVEGAQAMDYAYGLHNSTSRTTLGCGRILNLQARADLVAAVKAAWARGEEVSLEVT
jgi:hypothetical protein